MEGQDEEHHAGQSYDGLSRPDPEYDRGQKQSKSDVAADEELPSGQILHRWNEEEGADERTDSKEVALLAACQR